MLLMKLVLDVAVVKMINDIPIFVDSKVYDTRMSICLSCDQLGEWKICKLCKCFMHLKSRYKFARCPIGKWDSIESEIDSI